MPLLGFSQGAPNTIIASTEPPILGSLDALWHPRRPPANSQCGCKTLLRQSLVSAFGCEGQNLGTQAGTCLDAPLSAYRSAIFKPLEVRQFEQCRSEIVVLIDRARFTTEIAIAQLCAIAQQDEVLVSVGLKWECEGGVIDDGIRLQSHTVSTWHPSFMKERPQMNGIKYRDC
jgi:hypothetical protein